METSGVVTNEDLETITEELPTVTSDPDPGQTDCSTPTHTPARKLSKKRPSGRGGSFKRKMQGIMMTLRLSKQGQEITRCVDLLQSGVRVHLVRKKSMQEVFLRLEEDYLFISETKAESLRMSPEEAREFEADIAWWKCFGCCKKKADHSYVSLINVKELRDGPETETFERATKKFTINDDACFSLIMHSWSRQTVDFLVSDPSTKDAILRGLTCVIRRRRSTDVKTKQKLWIEDLFKKADKNRDGTLSLEEVSHLLQDLNVPLNIQAKFSVSDLRVNPTGTTTFDIKQFYHFYGILTRRPEVVELFEKYDTFGDGYSLDPNELQYFFQKEQQDDRSEEQCLTLIRKYEACPVSRKEGFLTLDGFNAMLMGEEMNIKNPEHRVVYQDMDQPLNHYFIDSSHNTYLTSDQVIGNSSVEAYIAALKSGCRAIELDCWDGPNKEPLIYHGFTMTSKIKFKDVITAINKHAFEMSDYPLILSLEYHCGVVQQEIMANYLKRTFGNRLYNTPITTDATQSLPSPRELRGEVILEARRIDDSELPQNEISENDSSPKTVQTPKVAKNKVSPELSGLVHLCHSVKFQSMEQIMAKYKPTQMANISEPKAIDLCNTSREKFIELNKMQVSRIYPKGTRVQSSNMDPFPMWCCGCQIVTMNYQTVGKEMFYYKGMFEDNGRCGYLLKPPHLTEDNSEALNNTQYPKEWKKNLKIKVVSGFQLPKRRNDNRSSILDPFVTIEISGVKEDRQIVKTQPIKQNGFHPVWNEEFKLEVLVPDLAVVLFSVVNKDPETVVAQYALRFNSIQNGYRTVNLKNPEGEHIWGSSLLLHIEKS